MIALDDARAEILSSVSVLTPVELPTTAALGCVLAADVRSDVAVPPFDNTAVDGFAVRAEDATEVPARLDVVATLAAGAAPERKVGPGEAIRIMTGAPMPPGADAVVMVEDTELDGEAVVIGRAAAPGDHVRPAGEDVSPGQVVFGAGTLVAAGHLGVLASIGRSAVSVYPRPRVGVLSTGDELVDDDRPLNPGEIRDANRPTLLALVGEAGCVGVDLGLARDTEAEITEALARGLSSCDALVTSGGVSMGDFDYIKVVLDQLGDMRWWQVAIKPAKPLAFGLVGGKPVFGLPGNPVSSMVSFELFARPALRRMMGHPQPERPAVRGVADEDLRRRPDGKVHFVRVVAEAGADGRYHVRSSGGQASNLLRSMALANALAVVPDGDGVASGGDVDVLLL